MRVRTAVAAFALATAGLIGSVGTATATSQPLFDIDYHLLSPVDQTCIINHPAFASNVIHVLSPEKNTCSNDA